MSERRSWARLREITPKHLLIGILAFFILPALLIGFLIIYGHKGLLYLAIDGVASRSPAWCSTTSLVPSNRHPQSSCSGHFTRLASIASTLSTNSTGREIPAPCWHWKRSCWN